MSTWYDYIFGTKEIVPDDKVLRRRHLLMKQIVAKGADKRAITLLPPMEKVTYKKKKNKRT